MALCGCGCGQETKTASKTNGKAGIKKGQPLKYVHGHNTRVVHPNREGHSPEVRAKMSASHKGKMLTSQHKKAIGESNTQTARSHGKREVRFCGWCGGKFEKTKSYFRLKPGKYCSKECYLESIRTSVPTRNKHSHREWKTEVRGRDGYTCRLCGYKGPKLHIHHIRRFSRYPDWGESPWNGITLCEDCHKEITHRVPKPIELYVKVEGLWENGVILGCELKDALEVFEMYDGRKLIRVSMEWDE